ncbi:MAG: hypothetical protein QM725_05225 [Lacibacter sp.]
MRKALINFDRYTDGNLESKTHTIISNMSGNPNFETPVPSIASLTSTASEFTAALTDAKTGNRSAIANKNNQRVVLVELLRSLATYVNFVCNGDASKLLSSGFDISKETQPSDITKPANFQVLNGVNSGELEMMVNGVKGAKSYLHEFTTDMSTDTPVWNSIASTSRKFTINNLQPGLKYYCRVGAVGAKGQLVYTDPVSRIVI